MKEKSWFTKKKRNHLLVSVTLYYNVYYIQSCYRSKFLKQSISWLISVDHENRGIQLLVVVIFCKLKENRKSYDDDDDDDAVQKLCSQRYKVQTVELTL